MKKKLLSIFLCITFVLPFAVSGADACDTKETVLFIRTNTDEGIEISDVPCEFLGCRVGSVETVKIFSDQGWYEYKVTVPEGVEHMLRVHPNVEEVNPLVERCSDRDCCDEGYFPQSISVYSYAEPEITEENGVSKLFGVEIENLVIVPHKWLGMNRVIAYVPAGSEWESVERLMLHPQVVRAQRDKDYVEVYTYLMGDMDMDWDVDAKDYFIAKRYCLKTIELNRKSLSRGHMNSDNVFDAKDYALIKRTALGMLDYRYVS
ncbi:MAG: dockerin type I repeat-containing protein [Clostridia bacterium]|nr:dockerin type I repeat-containing protein [Clostridia bacterium]